MIVCHDADGRLYNIYYDPIPDGLCEHLTEAGIGWIETASALSVVELSRQMYAIGGELLPRPACPAVLSVSGLSISLTDVPADATVILVLDPGDEFESRHPLSVDGGTVALDLDEPGPAHILVSSPWPIQEGRYDLDQQS